MVHKCSHLVCKHDITRCVSWHIHVHVCGKFYNFYIHRTNGLELPVSLVLKEELPLHAPSTSNSICDPPTNAPLNLWSRYSMCANTKLCGMPLNHENFTHRKYPLYSIHVHPVQQVKMYSTFQKFLSLESQVLEKPQHCVDFMCRGNCAYIPLHG